MKVRRDLSSIIVFLLRFFVLLVSIQVLLLIVNIVNDIAESSEFIATWVLLICLVFLLLHNLVRGSQAVQIWIGQAKLFFCDGDGVNLL